MKETADEVMWRLARRRPTLITIGYKGHLLRAAAVLHQLEGELARLVACFAEPGWEGHR
jgi:hypothetical protein